jgi:hypothetical protein
MQQSTNTLRRPPRNIRTRYGARDLDTKLPAASGPSTRTHPGRNTVARRSLQLIAIGLGPAS